MFDGMILLCGNLIIYHLENFVFLVYLKYKHIFCIMSATILDKWAKILKIFLIPSCDIVLLVVEVSSELVTSSSLMLV